MQSLPGITHIYTVLSSSLVDNIAYRSAAGLLVPVYSVTTPLAIIGDAVWDLAEEPDHGSQLQTITLTFRTTGTVDLTSPLAFVVRTVRGDTYIIGGKETPHPTVKVSETSGTPGGDPAVREYKITHKHRIALIKCVM